MFRIRAMTALGLPGGYPPFVEQGSVCADAGPAAVKLNVSMAPANRMPLVTIRLPLNGQYSAHEGLPES